MKRSTMLLVALLIVCGAAFGQTSVIPTLPDGGTAVAVTNEGEILGSNWDASYWTWSDDGVSLGFPSEIDLTVRSVYAKSDDGVVAGTIKMNNKLGFTEGASFTVVAGQDLNIFGNILSASDADGDTLEAFRDSSYVLRNDTMFVWDAWYSTWPEPGYHAYTDGMSFFVQGDSIQNVTRPGLFDGFEVIMFDLLVDSTRTSNSSALGDCFDITPDGVTAVGSIHINDGGYRAYYWNETDGLILLDDLQGTTRPYAKALEITDDGTLIVGQVNNDMGTPEDLYDDKLCLATWTLEGDVYVLDTLGVDLWANANIGSTVALGGRCVSSDGTYIAGAAEEFGISRIGHSMRWEVATGEVLDFTDQDWLPAGAGVGEFTTAVNDIGHVFGNVVYGGMWNTYYHGYMWTPEEGMIDFRAMLANVGIVSASTNCRIVDASPNGKHVLVGFWSGWDAYEYHLITMPPPAPLTITSEVVAPDTIRLAWSGEFHDGSDFNLQVRIKYAISDYWTEYYDVTTGIAIEGYDYIVAEAGTYQFKVAAVSNEWGGAVSPWLESEEIVIATSPDGVSDLAAVYDIENTTVGLTWVDNADDEIGFVIERRVNESDWEALAEAAVDAVSYTDDTVELGNVYYYRVAAEGTLNGSGWASTDGLLVDVAPAAPSDFESVFNYDEDAPEASTVTLTWTDNADNEDGYVVERAMETVGGDLGEYVVLAELDADVVEYTDANVAWENYYSYRLSAVNSLGASDAVTTDNTVSGVDDAEDSMLPTESMITGNYPNPFNGTTTVSFDLHKAMNVQMKLYSIDGRLVSTPFDAQRTAGSHQISLSLEHLASGTYFLQLRGEQFNSIRKIALLK